MSIFPFQLTTNRVGNLTRSIHTYLLYYVCDDRILHRYLLLLLLTLVGENGSNDWLRTSIGAVDCVEQRLCNSQCSHLLTKILYTLTIFPPRVDAQKVYREMRSDFSLNSILPPGNTTTILRSGHYLIPVPDK